MHVRFLFLCTNRGFPGLVPPMLRFLLCPRSLQICPNGETDILINGILALALHEISMEPSPYTKCRARMT